MSDFTTRAAAAAAILLLVAGCNARTSANSTAANEANAAPAAALAEGEWEISGTTQSPAGQPLAPPATSRSYIDAATAMAPSAEFFAGTGNGRCPNQNVRIAGGRISGSMICAGEGGFREFRVELNGTYSQRAFQVTIDTQAGGLSVRQEVRGRFLRP